MNYLFERVLLTLAIATLVLAAVGCQGDVRHEGVVQVQHSLEFCDEDPECLEAFTKALTGACEGKNK